MARQLRWASKGSSMALRWRHSGIRRGPARMRGTSRGLHPRPRCSRSPMQNITRSARVCTSSFRSRP
eukprot:8556393-Pyramimonas_sp.AAC.1